VLVVSRFRLSPRLLAVICAALLAFAVEPHAALAAPPSGPSTQTCLAGYHAAYWNESWSSVTASVGTVVSGWIQLKNTGCNLWQKGTGSEARLGTWNPQPGYNQNSPLCANGVGWVGCNRIVMADTQIIGFEQVATFNFEVRAPFDGVFTLYFRPVVDGQAWMEDLGLWVQLKTYSYYGVQNSNFKRPDGTNILLRQGTCLYCVPAATAGWISYVWQDETGSDGSYNFTQQYLWDSYFQVTSKTYSIGDVSSTTAYCAADQGGTIPYHRNPINDGRDDGVDPYGAAWGIFDHTPGSHYYNVNVYVDGPNVTGFDYGTRGMALTLSRYKQPVGLLVDAGGHYILGVGVIADQDPLNNFWGVAISKVLMRDPWNVIGGSPDQLVIYATGPGSQWANHFNRYGDGTAQPPAPPICPNCRDDARTGFGAFPVWWGDYVTVERGVANNTPNTLLRYQY